MIANKEAASQNIGYNIDIVRQAEGTFDQSSGAVATMPRGALLELGSQSEEALRRLFEDLGVEMVSLPADTPASELAELDVVALSGGANSVHDEDAPKVDPGIFSPDFSPIVVGVCLGAQMNVHHRGGTVVPCSDADNGTYGSLEVGVIDDMPAGGFSKIKQAKLVHSNGDHFSRDGLPEGFLPTAMTGEHVAAFFDSTTGNVGFQFHPELSDVVGYGIVRNVLQSRGLNLEPKAVDQFRRIVEEIEARAEGDDLVVAFSGGIDSNVIAEAVLASNIPREKIHIVHLDFGLNRTENGLPESQTALARFEARTGVRPHYVRLDPYNVLHTPVMLIDEDGNPEGEYVLSQVTDPELKRKIIAQIYANGFTNFIEDQGLDVDRTKIVQGTLYPDVIESLGKGKVKTHHNQSPIIVYWQKSGRVLDPARKLFKNDMRKIGKERGFLKIDYERHPFLGPGLGPRIICSDGTPVLPANAEEVWERAKEIVGDEFGMVLGGFKTVGQKGDKRSYAWPIMLTGEPDWERMSHLASNLSNVFANDINRLYYLTGEKTDGIQTAQEMTESYVNEETLDLLRPLDDVANELLLLCGALAVTDQVPIGLLPTPFRQSRGDRTLFLRPFRTPRSNSFLNGEAVRPIDHPSVAEWYKAIRDFALENPGIARIAYDVTNKPPGSTEVE